MEPLSALLKSVSDAVKTLTVVSPDGAVVQNGEALLRTVENQGRIIEVIADVSQRLGETVKLLEQTNADVLDLRRRVEALEKPVEAVEKPAAAPRRRPGRKRGK